jgi:hypothetical protein
MVISVVADIATFIRAEPWNFRFSSVNTSTSAGPIYEPECGKVYGPGSYRAHVLATAANAPAAPGRLDWSLSSFGLRLLHHLGGHPPMIPSTGLKHWCVS